MASSCADFSSMDMNFGAIKVMQSPSFERKFQRSHSSSQSSRTSRNSSLELNFSGIKMAATPSFDARHQAISADASHYISGGGQRRRKSFEAEDSQSSALRSYFASRSAKHAGHRHTVHHHNDITGSTSSLADRVEREMLQNEFQRIPRCGSASRSQRYQRGASGSPEVKRNHSLKVRTGKGFPLPATARYFLSFFFSVCLQDFLFCFDGKPRLLWFTSHIFLFGFNLRLVCFDYMVTFIFDRLNLHELR